MRYIEGINRKSKIVFPEYIDDYITKDNPVKIIDAFVESLDMEELEFKNAIPKNKDRPGYNPRDLLKLKAEQTYWSACLVGIYSLALSV